MVIAAAAKAGKFLKLLEPYRTQAPPDHPILMASKDTEYLKALFLYVEDMK